MNEHVRNFLAEASKISLTREERTDLRAGLTMAYGQRQGEFADAARSLQLSSEEKEDMRGVLQVFMRAHPERLSAGGVLRESIGWIVSRRFAAGITAAFLIATTGGGLAYAAEVSLPGDALYPLKVDVLEPFRERFVRNPKARAVWALQRLESRLEEAEELERRGRSVDLHSEEIVRRLGEHVEVLEERLALAQASDRKELEQRLEEKIIRHERLLHMLVPEEGTKQRENLLLRKPKEGEKSTHDVPVQPLRPPLPQIKRGQTERPQEREQKEIRIPLPVAVPQMKPEKVLREIRRRIVEKRNLPQGKAHQIPMEIDENTAAGVRLPPLDRVDMPAEKAGKEVTGKSFSPTEKEEKGIKSKKAEENVPVPMENLLERKVRTRFPLPWGEG